MNEFDEELIKYLSMKLASSIDKSIANMIFGELPGELPKDENQIDTNLIEKIAFDTFLKIKV